MPPAMTPPKVGATPSHCQSPHLGDKATVPCAGRVLSPPCEGLPAALLPAEVSSAPGLQRTAVRPSGWEKPGESGPKLPGSQIPTRDEGQAALALETESRGSEGGVTPPPEQPGVGGGWAVGKGPFPEFDFSGEVLPNFNSKEKEVSLLDMSVSCSSKQCIRQAPSVGPEPRAPTSQASCLPGRQGPPAPGKLSAGPPANTRQQTALQDFVHLHKNRSFYICACIGNWYRWA